jgi:16S rRNA (guanine527-N7)-methyltransferase
VTADLGQRVADRAAQEGLTLDENLRGKLVIYFDLLQHWNRRINLTGLTDTDEAIDRLLLEPLAAARYLPHHSRIADLGSGGGSPAIPLGLALSPTGLLMVESRARKCAFLREAAREVGLSATVESARFEEVARRPDYIDAFDLISVRAVRQDEPALASAAALVHTDGLVALFRGPQGPERFDASPQNLAWRETQPLLRSTRNRLTVLFHVERPRIG